MQSKLEPASTSTNVDRRGQKVGVQGWDGICIKYSSCDWSIQRTGTVSSACDVERWPAAPLLRKEHLKAHRDNMIFTFVFGSKVSA